MEEAEKEDPEAAKGYTSLRSKTPPDEPNIRICLSSPATCLVSKIQGLCTLSSTGMPLSCHQGTLQISAALDMGCTIQLYLFFK